MLHKASILLLNKISNVDCCFLRYSCSLVGLDKNKFTSIIIEK